MSWPSYCPGRPLQRLAAKLRLTKHAIQHWSREHFGNIFDAVKQAEEAVIAAEAALDSNPSQQQWLALQEAMAVMRNSMVKEEAYWRQKIRIKWLQDGDKNSRFFHAVVAERRAKSVIHRIRSSTGEWLIDEAHISTEAVEYFTSLFSAEPCTGSWSTLEVIPNIISREQNAELQRLPSMKEIKEVVLAMDGESAAGPDEFTGRFLTFAWNIVGHDVFEAIVSFFCDHELLRSVMSTLIVLLPKVSSPQDFSQFRSISLCNFVNKVISKLAARLSKSFAGLPACYSSSLADDVIVFSSGLRQSVRLVLKALDPYVSVSGQKVNQQKSCVLAHANFPGSRKRSIAEMIGFQSKEFLVRYLGYPLYAGRRRRCYFAGVCDSVTSKVLLWKERFFLHGGKLALIKSVLSSMPLHTFAASIPLKSIFSGMESIFADFLCSSLKARPCFQLCNSYDRRVEFMHCKYCSNLHPSFADTSPGDSWTWKRLGCWNVQRLSRVAPSGWVGRIVGVMPSSLDQTDTMVWAPSTSGVFSLASANRIAREDRNSSWLYSPLWLQGQPTKISFFMLRLVGSHLPVMDRLHKLGIFGPSCCGCCLHPCQESSDHIFCTEEAAKRIWGYFEGVIGGFQESFTIRHKLVSWWLKPTRNPYLQYLFRLLPSLICWNLWKMRNSFVFDAHLRPMARVCEAIFGDLRDIFLLKFKSITISAQDWPGFYGMVVGLHRVSRTLVVQWSCPVHNVVKLNSDGCSPENLGVSGGRGALVLGRKIIQGKTRCPWRLRGNLQDLLKVKRFVREVSHCFREANKPADRLANIGADSGKTLTYGSLRDLPRLVRGDFAFDQMGVPSLRRVRV
nr:uncharacterized protein LOC113704792 [Coffea arabica]